MYGANCYPAGATPARHAGMQLVRYAWWEGFCWWCSFIRHLCCGAACAHAGSDEPDGSIMHSQVIDGASELSKPVPINTDEPIPVETSLFSGVMQLHIR